jgi:hypothetical protein
MKRMLALILIGLYLCASTEAYQLLKVPMLISHFIKHCQEDPNTTLKGFLAEHYADETVFDEDWMQDMQLPFKTCEAGQSSVSATGKTDIVTIPNPQAIFVSISFTPIFHWLHSKMQVQKIFQPPRWA